MLDFLSMLKKKKRKIKNTFKVSSIQVNNNCSGDLLRNSFWCTRMWCCKWLLPFQPTRTSVFDNILCLWPLNTVRFPFKVKLKILILSTYSSLDQPARLNGCVSWLCQNWLTKSSRVRVPEGSNSPAVWELEQTWPLTEDTGVGSFCSYCVFEQRKKKHKKTESVSHIRKMLR